MASRDPDKQRNIDDERERDRKNSTDRRSGQRGSGRLGEEADDRMLYFLPSEGIDYDVIVTHLGSYLGTDATVTPRNRPNDGQPGYHIKTSTIPTKSIRSDLKMDTIKWRDEMRKSENRDYRLSQTCAWRQRFGRTRASARRQNQQ
jgi:hypothetical protein